DDGDEHAGGLLRVGDQQRLDEEALEIGFEMRLVPRSDTRDETDARPHGTQPHRLVRARSAGPRIDLRPPVGPPHQRPLGNDDDIGHHVPDDEDTLPPRRHRTTATPDMAAAMRAATIALFSTSAILATRLRPS